MPKEGMKNTASSSTLLSPDDTLPFKVLHKDATKPLLLVCDHASRQIPNSLGTMGVDCHAIHGHLGSDIGAGRLTTSLARSLSATAVLCQYSRLVIDCNRRLNDAEAFLQFGDGMSIPGNVDLHADDRQSRIDEIYRPYHNAISQQIGRLTEQVRAPLFISIHSFTPILDGADRPWEIGVLWDADRPTAKLFVEGFRQAGFIVGDNEPYSGKAPQDFTIDHHAEAIGLPHVGIEIRQDLISSDEGVESIRKCFHSISESVCSQLQHSDIGNSGSSSMQQDIPA